MCTAFLGRVAGLVTGEVINIPRTGTERITLDGVVDATQPYDALTLQRLPFVISMLLCTHAAGTTVTAMCSLPSTTPGLTTQHSSEAAAPSHTPAI
jgi:hypothetical protein